ncbi:MAG: hypothetical protein HF976_08980 [ANME-2 cluster archaeon]|nr:hypothetical protein [ANME-2 cluster archaeon]MBC2701530.1 hypothetical protein [ANME-2 cluster archaeon]MBC2706825.1 hypothetical protein [ANME-2 cluster archaeon]MBC2746114.1 hypothetical protein [ANME-2 cluster archaeon]
MSPTTKPTSGLPTLWAAAADTGELCTILHSAALLVIFDGEQTRAGGFSPAVGHDFFFDVLFLCLSLLCFKARQSPTPDFATL